MKMTFIRTRSAVACPLAIGLALIVAPAANAESPTNDALRAGGCSIKAVYETGGKPVRRFPNDPLFARQWPLDEMGVKAAWRRGARGRSVTVAVVDTGVDLNHPDLDDKLEPGIDLVEGGPGQAVDCPVGPQDEDFHGTAVAGVVAAETNNGVGVAGTAPRSRLMPVRVRGSVDSHDFSQVGAGIRYAADHGAKVISLTGGVIVPIRPDPVLEEDISEALDYAWARGVVTVATAGNNGVPWCQYPASQENVVCAAAVDREGQPAGYSQFPVSLSGGVALRAPGGSRTGDCESRDDIWTTMLPGSKRDCGPSFAGYDTDSGTTYATAHTAGVMALLASRGLTNVQIVDCLKTTSTNRGSYDPVMGYGVVDANRATRKCVPG